VWKEKIRGPKMDLCGTEALRGEQNMWLIYACPSSPGLQDCCLSSLGAAREMGSR